MLRIVAGEWGNRRIQAPRGRGTRPTAERAREGLFNVLSHQIDLAAYPVFDLYAGSGALGIEALSRGAPHATFVESDARAARQIAGNLRTLGAAPERWVVVTARVESWLGRTAFPFVPALVLLDPPYGLDTVPALLDRLAAHPGLLPGSRVIVEHAANAGTAGLRAPAALELTQAKRYGDTSIAFFSKSLHDADRATAAD